MGDNTDFSKEEICDQTLFWQVEHAVMKQPEWQQATPAASCLSPANLIIWMFKGLAQSRADADHVLVL